MPQPPSSIQPVHWHVRQPTPPQIPQVMSNSADGSVNGKYEGRSRDEIALPKYAEVNSSSVPARSVNEMPRSTTRPSIWWKTGMWLASAVSRRNTRPGQIV